MVRLFGVLLLLCTIFSIPLKASEDGYFRLLNSYLALKLHLAENPKDGKLVGAAWIRFENRTGEKVTKIPLLLNPGLKVTKIVATKGQPLPFSQQTKPIKDWPKLKLNAVTADTGQGIKHKGIYEITVNFEGSIEPLTESGMGYVRESLSSDFTIFRFENFGYPVLAKPTDAAISAAGQNQNYYQSATLEVPEGYVPAGNLPIEKKTLLDKRVTYDLKSETPIPFLMLPIARYGQIKRENITVNFLEGGRENAEKLALEAERTLALFTRWFGPSPDRNRLAITAIPEGYGSQRMPGLIIQDEAAFKSASNYDELYHEIAHLWHPKEPSLKPSRWNEGLAMLMQAIAADTLQGTHGLQAFKENRFSRTRDQFTKHADYGTTPLANYGDKGLTDLSYSSGAVFFAMLHDLLGHDRFLTLIRDMQQEFAISGASTGTFATYLMERMPNRKAEDFVEGWFLAGGAGQDIQATESYAALVEKYRQ